MDPAVIAAAIGVGGTVVVGVSGFWASVRNTSQTIAGGQQNKEGYSGRSVEVQANYS
jgi:hypothetical protein